MFSGFCKVAGKSTLMLPAPATLENRLAKLASDLSEKRVNSKVIG
jgi:hypothetical protein